MVASTPRALHPAQLLLAPILDYVDIFRPRHGPLHVGCCGLRLDLNHHTVAQMTSNATCADLKPHITFNSSTTRQIPALRIAGSSSDEIAVQNDTSRSQDLTLGIKPAGVYSMQDIINNNTEYLGSTSTLLLDTGDSDVTDMGACHNTIHPSHFGSWFHFTKERMMKSLSDNRDYTALLSEACVKALKTHYLTQAANVSMRGQACEDYNSTLPRDRAYLQVIPTRKSSLRAYYKR